MHSLKQDGDTPIVNPTLCALKCSQTPGCTYYVSRAARSKGCILKSHKRGKPTPNADILGHGHCAHELPLACTELRQTLAPALADTSRIFGSRTFEAYHRYNIHNIGSFRDVTNAGGCAQKCAETSGCKYWVVTAKRGCVLNTKKRGRLERKTKLYMYHGECSGTSFAAAKREPRSC